MNIQLQMNAVNYAISHLREKISDIEKNFDSIPQSDAKDLLWRRKNEMGGELEQFEEIQSAFFSGSLE